MKKRLVKLCKVGTVLSVILLIFIILSNSSIENSSKGKTFSETTHIPNNKVGLLLGTSKYLQNGDINLYYKYRIEAAAQLFKSKKIDYIVVSGDNGSKNYDEPTTFKNDLILAGIPEGKIYLDYAGFRTLDSVVRVKEIFGQENVTIISQQFHNERAIYLADNFGIKAVGFNAKDISGRYGLKVKLREYLARTKVFLDILFNVQPKFLGERIVIQ